MEDDKDSTDVFNDWMATRCPDCCTREPMFCMKCRNEFAKQLQIELLEKIQNSMGTKEGEIIRIKSIVEMFTYLEQLKKELEAV